MSHYFSKSPLIVLVGASLLLSGCATVESVEHAQATADSAVGLAHAAGSAAQRAQSTADGAASGVQAVGAEAQRANARLDAVELKLDRLMRHHRSHHHHRAHARGERG
jgi:outer membrane murein-binding lipoprotein Lpp